MGISGSNRIVTFACIVCAVSRDAAELLVWRDLVEKIRQSCNRRTAVGSFHVVNPHNPIWVTKPVSLQNPRQV
jgi:hypothetical protein